MKNKSVGGGLEGIDEWLKSVVGWVKVMGVVGGEMEVMGVAGGEMEVMGVVGDEMKGGR